MALSQLDIMVLRIRVLIGDFNVDADENRYTDSEVKKMLRVAIEQDSGIYSVGLGGASKIVSDDEAYVDYEIVGMSESAEAIYCLAAQLMILEAEFYKYIAEGGGIATTLGPTHVDEKSVINAMKSNLETIRTNYKKTLNDYRLGHYISPVRISLYPTGRVSP